MNPDTFYHIFNHANGKDNLFRKDSDFRLFLQRMLRYIKPVAEIYAYCLMPNHFHFLIRIKSEDELTKYFSSNGMPPSSSFRSLLSLQFSKYFNSYAKTYNRKYKRMGSLFNTPFKRKNITEDLYLTAALIYIHRNPRHHGFCHSLYKWPYSSYRCYINSDSSIINIQLFLTWFNGLEEFVHIHESA